MKNKVLFLIFAGVLAIFFSPPPDNHDGKITDKELLQMDLESHYMPMADVDGVVKVNPFKNKIDYDHPFVHLTQTNDQPTSENPTNLPRDETEPEDPDISSDEDVGWFDWIKNNWAEIAGILLIILALGEAIVKITPTEKDNAWFKWLRNIIDMILPNRKSGGGTHTK